MPATSPRAFAGEEDLRLKAQAWEEFRVTTHWPARNVHLFPKSQPGKGMCTVSLMTVNGRPWVTQDSLGPPGNFQCRRIARRDSMRPYLVCVGTEGTQLMADTSS